MRGSFEVQKDVWSSQERWSVANKGLSCCEWLGPSKLKARSVENDLGK